ncbi:MAG TPA: prephenate dehydrogenase/arogenate dehydrogenase family protein [Candidatus Lokiarchaeia archaeon]|nr:prephenate dehydrogenase/arogenate dehydrogenase family protein [Candidatus Lokiarchaeia archaeon]
MEREHSITIIGATGLMGRWFLTYFASRDWTVHGYSRSSEKLKNLENDLKVGGMEGKILLTNNLEDCVPVSSWVMLSVPITAHEESISAVAPLVNQDAVLFDIASVKGVIPSLLNTARQEHGIHVLSTHPMFGPGAESMKNKNFILIDLEGDKMILDEFKAIIEQDKPTVIETSVQEHDGMIAYTLGIPHMLNILFGKFLKDSDASLEKIVAFEGTTFHLQHLISQEVMTQDPFIYATIELENQAFIDMLSNFKATVDKFIDLLQRKDYDEFEQEFLAVREYYSIIPEFTSAAQRFNSAARRSLDIIKEGKAPDP